jgi:multicomponent Na+:H+ antiporter subunit G
MIGESLVLAGALLTLLSGIGVVRFGDVLARMHALTKASTLGVLLAVIGAAIALSHPNDVTSLLLAGALQLLTSPVAANLLGRATFLASGIETTIDAVDEHGEHDLPAVEDLDG